MGAACPAGQYWDSLVKTCLPCNIMCQQPLVVTRCTDYCALADCTTLPGHYYDALLKKCVTCSDVCGRHPTQCHQHCEALSVPVTSKNVLVRVPSHLPNPSGLSVEDSSVLVYSLMALCMGLLLASLSVALAIFLRRSKARRSTDQERVNKACQGVAERGPRDCVARLSGAADGTRPTETSVCVHCFPDFTAVDDERLHRDPLTHDVLNHTRIQHQRPLWTADRSHTPTLEVQGGAMVG
ncbi:tumor necrosis factor receptor superfamily member 13B isoform X1 [Nerophis lumbriciformis]|uniref:tumor necrosis factor receptor superfamily member 13B isoform X1 n=1 Tax=Nerophis lumbriciformis TaxID=546530 RepID=UPI002ADFA481|nr:tumor necrosis factor receptor superfamily member 13B-like isoform X1 [Nerophis lumbriciformis]